MSVDLNTKTFGEMLIKGDYSMHIPVVAVLDALIEVCSKSTSRDFILILHNRKELKLHQR